MRPRTRRLKSLLAGIDGSFGQATGDPFPSNDARGAPKDSAGIRECAPLCLTKTLAGAGSKRLGVDHRPWIYCASTFELGQGSARAVRSGKRGKERKEREATDRRA